MRRTPAVVVFLLSSLALGSAFAASSGEAPLIDYSAREDPSFGWKVRRTGTIGPTSYAELILTSQTWRGITWKHQLYLVKPSTADDDVKHALLFITGGRWKDELLQPAAPDEPLPRKADMYVALAEQLKTPVAILRHVPHQPMFDGKREDELIAYTFSEFLETGDTSWPLLVPMVKSAVRAMDTLQTYARDNWNMDVETFTVSGASKRGWTTWLTGAVDRRVTAIAPIVIDVLNMAPQMRHQKEVWGDLSHKISEYTERDLHSQLETEAGEELRSIVDPYSYRERLTQSKLVILGTNDRYWPLDALSLYWDDLEGPKHVLYVPNNRHRLTDLERLIGSLNALHQSAASGEDLPQLDWSFEESEAVLVLSITSNVAAREVTAWIATSSTRDFREAIWRAQPAHRVGDRWVYDLPHPEHGYAAVFGEAVYEGDGLPYYLSTTVKIVKAQPEIQPARSEVEDSGERGGGGE